MRWHAPSINCWKSRRKQDKQSLRRSEKSVDSEDFRPQTNARRWWTSSQQWGALIKQPEEQVFLLVTLLIGALVGVTVVDALPVLRRAEVLKLEGVVALQDVLKFYGFASQNTDDRVRVDLPVDAP